MKDKRKPGVLNLLNSSDETTTTTTTTTDDKNQINNYGPSEELFHEEDNINLENTEDLSSDYITNTGENTDNKDFFNANNEEHTILIKKITQRIHI